MSREACIFFFNDTATTEIYTLSLHDALPILRVASAQFVGARRKRSRTPANIRRSILSSCFPATSRPWAQVLYRSEEHTSELQSQSNLVCRLLLEKKKNCSPTSPHKRVTSGL